MSNSTYPYEPVMLAEDQGWIVRDARDGKDSGEVFLTQSDACDRAHDLMTQEQKRRDREAR